MRYMYPLTEWLVSKYQLCEHLWRFLFLVNLLYRLEYIPLNWKQEDSRKIREPGKHAITLWFAQNVMQMCVDYLPYQKGSCHPLSRAHCCFLSLQQLSNIMQLLVNKEQYMYYNKKDNMTTLIGFHNNHLKFQSSLHMPTFHCQ